MGKFIFHAYHLCHVIIGITLFDILMSEDKPVIAGADRHAGTFRCMHGAALGGGISKLPFFQRNLLSLFPVAMIVIPVMGAFL
jgi:hypothetical protein